MWQVDGTGTAVVIAAVGDKEGGTYADFLANLPDSDCRYGGARGRPCARWVARAWEGTKLGGRNEHRQGCGYITQSLIALHVLRK